METVYDVSTIKRHAFLAMYNNQIIGPLAEAPKIEYENKTYDSLIYENGGNEEVSKTITRRCARITIRTKNVEDALTLAQNFSAGADVIAAAARKSLSFTPITSSGTEKVLTFPAAALMPDVVYDPGMGSDHTATLTFMAYSDDSGTLFTFV